MLRNSILFYPFPFRKVLGVLSSSVALPILVGLAITFGLFGLAGRFIDQSVEDIEEENNGSN